MCQLFLRVVGTNALKEGEMLLEQLKPKVKRRIPLLEVNVLDEDSLSRTISKYDLCVRFVPGEKVTMTTEMSSVLFLAMVTVTMVISIQSNLDYPNPVS